MEDTGGFENLVVIWTSKDRELAQNMAFVYARNFQFSGMWNKVRLVVWGAAVKLLSKDQELQDELEGLKKIGIEIHICKDSADGYDVSEKLSKLGADFILMGDPLTEYLKGRWARVIF